MFRTATVHAERANGQDPSADDPRTEWVTITPELAAEWLSRKDPNRNYRQPVALGYAADMQAGDWTRTAETIKFASDGALIDGQHRLGAIVEAGVPSRELVVWDLEKQAQQDIDSGIPRKFHDVLKLRGEVNTHLLAAIVRRVHLWERGRRRNLNSGSPSHGVTSAQLLRTLEDHPELRDVASYANTVSSRCDLPASLVGLAYWAFSQIDEEDASEFFDRLVDGQRLAAGNPIYELRRTLHNITGRRTAHDTTLLLAVTIKAWNAYRLGETVRLLRWKAGGAKPESFPEPV